MPQSPDSHSPFARLTPADKQLLQDFERGELSDFPHADHVRLAWVHLSTWSWPESALRFDQGLKRLTIQLGVPDKYHATITWAFLLLIQERMHEMKQPCNWSEFAEAHPDLLNGGINLLYQYYDPALLHSDRARQMFLLPARSAA